MLNHYTTASLQNHYEAFACKLKKNEKKFFQTFSFVLACHPKKVTYKGRVVVTFNQYYINFETNLNQKYDSLLRSACRPLFLIFQIRTVSLLRMACHLREVIQRNKIRSKDEK